MTYAYLVSLLFGIAGPAIIDWRYRLAFWRDKKRTLSVVGIAMGIFIVWDALGIALGIFSHGNSAYALPFVIAPEFPLEELVFLFLLNYCTLIIYQGVSLWRSRTLS